jgi:DNA-directed RNA polymerase specialized sigma24 family protein
VSTAQTEDGPLAADLLAAARGGDGEAFRALVGPYLRALHVHAYRMLGSLDDADEAVQDTLLSAWRALEGYQGQAPLSHWLYRITTSSLKVIRAKGRRPVPAGEVGHLQPYLPDQSARCHGYGIMVFTATSEGIATITGFPSPNLFERFGLPSHTD